jgi:hypothetical protein
VVDWERCSRGPHASHVGSSFRNKVMEQPAHKPPKHWLESRYCFAVASSCFNFATRALKAAGWRRRPCFVRFLAPEDFDFMLGLGFLRLANPQQRVPSGVQSPSPRWAREACCAFGAATTTRQSRVALLGPAFRSGPLTSLYWERKIFCTAMHRFAQKIRSRPLVRLSRRAYAHPRLSRGASKTSRHNQKGARESQDSSALNYFPPLGFTPSCGRPSSKSLTPSFAHPCTDLHRKSGRDLLLSFRGEHMLTPD